MKNLFISIIALGCASLVACDPIENRDELSGAITADQLNITAVPEIRDGVNSNYIHVSSDGNPVLPSWDYGSGTLQATDGVVQVLLAGDNDIVFTGWNGNGTQITKKLTVHVDRTYDVPEEWGLFCGDGSKTWVFDATTDNNHPYGIGGSGGDRFPTWWGPEYGSFDEWDAKMTFALDGGAIFTKTLSNGTVQKGTFSFDLSKKVGTWSRGIVSFKGASIPNPVSVNNKAGNAYDFYIITLAPDQLVLSNMSGNGVPDNPSGEANFWMFRPEGYTK
ncbi:hypothetical protein AGMMS49574_24670 [Bacteroidia bacterium]|nr:hypothetical protein AGMMS49574_24670 [Bacteroidia bacterium]GHU57899.1 hypothetical protein FACS189411_12380 [Bacteroidia bacterium]GHV03961.1 hypothetical protein FACS189416_1310 [Bacteroidia bacterium]